uniref:EF-hand domain-containing protein n=1 Tax=Oryza rufipogon TaxID=4529 RepID=A0A0E0MYA7_ORYRU
MPPPPSATAGRRSPFSALLLYVTFALVILLLLTSYSPSIPHRGRSLHRRLKLHPRNPSLSGAGAGAPTGGNGAPQQQQNHHHAAPFDPEIAELERRLEDKEWEREHYRILHGDGGGGEADEHMREWEEWNLEQSRADQLHRSAREMELYDKNGDGVVSYGDFRAQHNESSGEVNSLGFPWWKEEHFNASDADGHGFLNKTEFNDFLNPSDSENPQIINLLCKQEIRQRDKDGDGKLNFEEYFHGLHDHIHGYDDENADISHIGNNTVAKERFSKLDKDSDGFISEHELEPVLDKLHLSERYYARQQAAHAISEADKDHDGRLTLDEMIENPFININMNVENARMTYIVKWREEKVKL